MAAATSPLSDGEEGLKSGPVRGGLASAPSPGFYSLFFSSFQGGLSASETTFTREGVVAGVRADGRDATCLRPRTLASNVFPLSVGSAALQSEENAVVVTVDVGCGEALHNFFASVFLSPSGELDEVCDGGGVC